MAEYEPTADPNTRILRDQVVPRPAGRFSESYVQNEAGTLAQTDGRIQYDPNKPPIGIEETQAFFEDQENCRPLA